MSIDWDKVRECVEQGYISSQRHQTEPLTIYNYTAKTAYDWYWTPETMACRGLIVADSGEVVARPFPKFFSVEQLNGQIPCEPFEVYDKLDGSLGVLYPTADGPQIATRGSFVSEQAKWATAHLRSKYPLAVFDKSLTYLFEIIYRANRIVIDYGDFEDLVLLAIIDTATGRDMRLQNIGLPVVERYDGIKDFDELKKRESAHKEGFVVRFIESGQRVKLKFEEYKRLHKLLTGVNARYIWEELQTPEGLQPILERVPDEFYQWVRDIESVLRSEYIEIEERCKVDFKDCGDRKTTALYFQTCQYPAVLFKMLDGKDYAPLIWKLIRPDGATTFKVDEL
jgi:RNA ligase